MQVDTEAVAISCAQVKLGLSIDEEEGGADDEDLPPLEEDIVDEGSRMEEVD